MKLKNKIAFITGGSRGIGCSIVKTLAREGAKVIFTYNSNAAAALTATVNLKNEGIETTFYQMNVANRESVRKVVKIVAEKHGKIDILVNNAGINKPTDFDIITDKDWDDILNVNLKGPFICTQEF